MRLSFKSYSLHTECIALTNFLGFRAFLYSVALCSIQTQGQYFSIFGQTRDTLCRVFVSLSCCHSRCVSWTLRTHFSFFASKVMGDVYGCSHVYTRIPYFSWIWRFGVFVSSRGRFFAPAVSLRVYTAWINGVSWHDLFCPRLVAQGKRMGHHS